MSSLFKKIFIVTGSVVAIASAVIGTNLFSVVPKAIENTTWMKNLDDSAKLSELSIPGTHDSGATHSIGDVAGKCQDLTIAQQLNLGVRFLDMRVQLRKDDLHVVHGFVDQNLKFSDAMNTCGQFLRDNPSEALLISVKEDADPSNSSVAFESKMSEIMQSAFGSDFYKESTLPATLGDARGKAILLSRYEESTIGVDCSSGWADNKVSFDLGCGIHVQDYYKFADSEEKKQPVLDCLEYAQSNSATHSSPLVINFFSGYLSQGFPPSYSVPVAKVMKPFALEHIKDYTCTGACLFDFVTQGLCDEIIGRNSL
ncbi:MAG: phosphatidylinositol-specific phospholipase C [Bacilli bacterium]|nr:phosphatidylinositol-specific phospholipase C [Bacilli bacterium]